MGGIPQKIHILKFIAEQGVVTVDDVNQSLFNTNKSSIIRAIFEDGRKYPAGKINPGKGELLFVVDQQAAGELCACPSCQPR